MAFSKDVPRSHLLGISQFLQIKYEDSRTLLGLCKFCSVLQVLCGQSTPRSKETAFPSNPLGLKGRIYCHPLHDLLGSCSQMGHFPQSPKKSDSEMRFEVKKNSLELYYPLKMSVTSSVDNTFISYSSQSKFSYPVNLAHFSKQEHPLV